MAAHRGRVDLVVVAGYPDVGGGVLGVGPANTAQRTEMVGAPRLAWLGNADAHGKRGEQTWLG